MFESLPSGRQMNRINLFHNSKFTLAAARFRDRMIETEREILRQSTCTKG